MKKPFRSRYVQVNKQSTLIKKWIASLLLQAELEDYLIFERIDRRILCLFDTTDLTSDILNDAEFIRAWLGREYDNCGDTSFDESDVFCINTRNIARLTGLNKVELAVLRFAILLNQCNPLESAADIGSNDLSETDVCDLLQTVLGEPFEGLYQAFDPDGRLQRTGLLKSGSRWSSSRKLAGWLQTPELLLRQVFREQQENGTLGQMFYTPAPRSTLAKQDFRHLEPKLSLVKDYLRASCKTREAGVNILLWGPPGTGKTELARYLAQSLRKRAMEINSMDVNREALSAAARFDCYRLCQAIAGQTKNTLVIYDEVEEILSDDNFARHGFKAASSSGAKCLVNTVLETNAAPAIWITNTLAGVDPAYLRRFDLSWCLKRPVGKNKARIAKTLFKQLPVGQEIVEQIAGHNDITPAHLRKASRICARLGADSTQDASFIVQQVINGDLEAIQAEPIRPGAEKSRDVPRLDYHAGLINSDTDLEELGQLLDQDSSARICLYGPPGTGKTAWAHYLATAIKRPLLIKSAAEILDAFIGNTEKNIVAAFAEASSSKSILLLDEVDSFLQNRSTSRHHWEVAHVNQFLTAMEQYEGILICTTNLLESLDPATLRRFDLKVSLNYLASEQALLMALNLFSGLSVKLKAADRGRLASAIAGLELSHGDFAALYRRYSVLKSTPTVDTLVSDLKLETSFREKGAQRPIGFTAKYANRRALSRQGDYAETAH
jgi:SpoVK/Ycf46/Vps4 family AAA+-type ATPase